MIEPFYSRLPRCVDVRYVKVLIVCIGDWPEFIRVTSRPPRFRGFRRTNEIFIDAVVTRIIMSRVGGLGFFLFGLVSLPDERVPFRSLCLHCTTPRLCASDFDP